METSAIPPIGDTANSASKAFQTASHSFTLRVQGAVGSKSLSGYGLEGRVLVAFSLGSDGTLATLRVAKSSGYDRLDRVALQIVGATAFPSPPAGVNVAHRTYVSAFTFS